nr:putative peptidoglycan-binding domain-containing protein [Acinetobacter baumannii]
MDQIRPFPPTDFMDQAEEEEALRLIPAPDLKLWVVANFLTLGGPLHNPDQGNMKDLPLDVAKAIYRKQYWIEPRFDQVNTLSSAVAEELLDTGVNCGTGFAKPLLQRALNLLNNQGKAGWPDLKVDGVYGSATLGALKTYLSKRGKDGEKVLVRVLNIMQGQRYIEICERNPKQEQFFYGWINNRIA